MDRCFDWPINARLYLPRYLPRAWAEDRERREWARVPQVQFRTVMCRELIDVAPGPCDDQYRPKVIGDLDLMVLSPTRQHVPTF